MSDQPITLAVLTEALARFHESVFLPSLRETVAASEHRLLDTMHTLHDELLERLDRLAGQGIREGREETLATEMRSRGLD